MDRRHGCLLIVLGSLQIALIMLASSRDGVFSRLAAITSHAPLPAVPSSALAAQTGGSGPAFSVLSAAR